MTHEAERELTGETIRNTEWEWYGRPGFTWPNHQGVMDFWMTTRVGRVMVYTIGGLRMYPYSLSYSLINIKGPSWALFGTVATVATSGEKEIKDTCYYRSAEDAERGHLEMCERWSTKERQDSL